MSVAATLERFAATMPRVGTADIRVARVRLFGTRAWVACRPDHDQRRLRQAHGIPPVLGLDLLSTLMNLPLGLPIPLQAVSVADSRRLRRTPAGAVTWSESTVTRRIAPPVAPLLAMVQSTDWTPGLRAASRFAAYCPRLMIITEMPSDAETAFAEASFYGIGVVIRRGAALDVLVEPEAFTEWQPTPAWWWFAEEVHRGVERTPR